MQKKSRNSHTDLLSSLAFGEKKEDQRTKPTAVPIPYHRYRSALKHYMEKP
jgi:hypothetical protein